MPGQSSFTFSDLLSSSVPSHALPHSSGKFCLPNAHMASAQMSHTISHGLIFFPWPFGAHNSPGRPLSPSNPSLQRPSGKKQGSMRSHSVCAKPGLECRPWVSQPRAASARTRCTHRFPQPIPGLPSQWPRLPSPQASCCTASWDLGAENPG